MLGVAAAAVGSGIAGLGAGGAAIGIAVGVALLYAGFTRAERPEPPRILQPPPRRMMFGPSGASSTVSSCSS